jgi:hypothetical protein
VALKRAVGLDLVCWSEDRLFTLCVCIAHPDSIVI